MKMITKKRKKENKLQEAVFPVILGVIFVGIVSFLVISDLRINQKRSEMLETIKGLEEEIEFLETEKETLESGLIQTEDTTYWEEKLRDQGYKKPGEEAVVVLPAEEGAGEKESQDKSFWDKVKETLGI
jgi:hypothetical protein